MEAQFSERKTEPNSGLGKAISYLLNHWAKLTLFLKQPGVPIDNNLVERSLKRAEVTLRITGKRPFLEAQRIGFLAVHGKQSKCHLTLVVRPADWAAHWWRVSAAYCCLIVRGRTGLGEYGSGL
jgi:hypothetical protein